VFFLELPSIQPFSFGRPIINQGEVGQLLCTVLTGDEPLTISWSYQGDNLSTGPHLTISQLGPRTSILMISSITYHHAGTYTCMASNAAGSASFSSELKMNGKYIRVF
jgi:Immunoglobulin I-set domain